MLNQVCHQWVSFLSRPAHYTIAWWPHSEFPAPQTAAAIAKPLGMEKALCKHRIFFLWSTLIFEQEWFQLLPATHRPGGVASCQFEMFFPWFLLKREGVDRESRLLCLFKQSATVPRKWLGCCRFYASLCPSLSSKAFINICSNLETNVKLTLTVWQRSVSFILHHDSVLFYAWSSMEHCCHMLLKLWLK